MRHGSPTFCASSFLLCAAAELQVQDDSAMQTEDVSTSGSAAIKAEALPEVEMLAYWLVLMHLTDNKHFELVRAGEEPRPPWGYADDSPAFIYLQCAAR